MFTIEETFEWISRVPEESKKRKLTLGKQEEPSDTSSETMTDKNRDELTNTEKLALNKRACELLGICWHEPIFDGSRICLHCGALLAYGKANDPLSKEEFNVMANPDFTTDAGKVELLRLIRKQKDWYYFVKQMDIGLVRRNPIGERFTLLNTEYILDTTGLLLKAAVEWMEGRK